MGYIRPTRLTDAFDALDAGASVIAGGTDWFPARGDRIAPGSMLDVTSLAECRGIAQTLDGWRIGAAVTWSDVIRATLPSAFDALKAAAREVGSVQIQNVATLVGNICNASPAADGVPPLLALGAEVEVQARAGERRVPLADFITGPRKTTLSAGELVTALHIPKVPEGAVSAFQKLGARRYLVISVAMVAIQLRPTPTGWKDVRIAVGACGPVASRLSALEQRLTGTTAAPRVTASDLVPLSPISDIRGSDGYRLDTVATMIERMLADLS